MLNRIKTIILGAKPAVYHRNSFAQSGEDMIVDFIFNQIRIINPSYLDIGAHHPSYLNNTAFFYEKGSRGINIEPDPSLFKAFENDRKGDINLNIGISDRDDLLDFFIINEPTLNTFSKEEAEKYANLGNFFIVDTKKIPVTTVSKLLNQHYQGKFPDFLTLDAEGIDEIVLKSIDFDNNFPKVICVETISFSQKGGGVKNKSIIDFLQLKGYLLYADTNINSIFVKENLWVRV
jgi:FkbM family methyltransferase